MAKQVLLILITIALFETAWPLSGQNEGGAKVLVLAVRSLIQVEINVQEPGNQLFIPFCEKRQYGDESLCTGTARLEVETGHEWRSAKLRTNDAVLGGFNPKGGAKGILIPPGGGDTFMFEFSKDLFAVERGQRLRVVVDAWPDEESMKANKPSIQLASPPFECP
jgi:hypothetical protein